MTATSPAVAIRIRRQGNGRIGFSVILSATQGLSAENSSGFSTPVTWRPKRDVPAGASAGGLTATVSCRVESTGEGRSVGTLNQLFCAGGSATTLDLALKLRWLTLG